MPADTRSRLLCAAVSLFAEHGYDGTTVAAVSERAEANIAAVNYHFRDKQSLYVEALRAAFEAAKARHPVIPAEPLSSPEEALRFHIHALVEQIFSKDEGGDFIHMFAREMAQPTFAVDLIFSELVSQNRDNLRSAVRGILGEAAGPQELQLAVLSVAAQFQFYNFSRAIREMMGRKGPHLPRPERIAEHIYEFSIDGLNGLKERLRLEGRG